MSGIFGLIDPVRGPEDRAFDRMIATMRPWGRDAIRSLAAGGACFGQAITFDTPEAPAESLPRFDTAQRILFTAEARLDNRGELCTMLELEGSERRCLPDGDLVFFAYQRWGRACVTRLCGDWSFAAWHADDRTAVLARDHGGNTSLHYCCLGDRFAFSADLGALLQLTWVPRMLDEIVIAKLLIRWRARSETPYAHIHCIPPGHLVSVRGGQAVASQYWSLEDLPETRLPNRSEYADALGEMLRQAVRSRLRAYGPIGTTLSGGLDSGAVTAVAARELQGSSRPLTAFTAVPREGFPAAHVFGLLNEGPAAAAVARQWSGIDHVLVSADNVTPLQALDAKHAIVHVPRAAMNAYWILSLLQAAAGRGIRTLLTGQAGNCVFSWHGYPGFWHMLMRRRQVWRAVRQLAPDWLRRLKRRGWNLARLLDDPWRTVSAIEPQFAREIRLLDRVRSAGYDPLHVKRLPRATAILDDAGITGPGWAQLGAAYGLDVRDPSLDKRLREFAYSIPDRIWRGQLPRALFREAMRGVLPEETRLNPVRGVQAADLCERLADNEAELEAAFRRAEASSLARRFVDLAYCRQTARHLRTPDRLGPRNDVCAILMPGLDVALFLAGVERGEPRILPDTEIVRARRIHVGPPRAHAAS